MTFLWDTFTPETLTGKELDEHLKQGGFRIGQTIYKFDFAVLNDDLYVVHWLRMDLQRLSFSKGARKIMRRNLPFTVTVKPFYISEEADALYKAYKTNVDFESSETIFEYLHHGADRNVFNSYVAEVRDDNKLIAAGYFDRGEKSLAAILNFYNPEYRSYSLGKFLMLQQILYGQQQGLDWFYPGYIVDQYPKFDYKIFADIRATQFYHREEEQWLPFAWPLPQIRLELPEISNDDEQQDYE